MAPHDPSAIDLLSRLQGPSLVHPLGTDHMGRCVFSRLIHGFRVTPLAAVAVVALAAGVGTAVGLVSGYAGGLVDSLIMRLVEGFFVFPAIAVAPVLAAVLGLGMGAMVMALAAVHWAEYARVARPWRWRPRPGWSPRRSWRWAARSRPAGRATTTGRASRR